MTYNEFIQDILETRGRFGIPEGEYKERHHIVPSCVGGSNNEENLIDLYAREHFIAHKMLMNENGDNLKLAYAWLAMATSWGRPDSGRNDIKLTPEEYEERRVLMSELAKNRFANGEASATKDTLVVNDGIHKKHIHKNDIDKFLANNDDWRLGGLPISDEQKLAISSSNKGKEMSTETRIKLANANEGKKPWNKGLSCGHLTKDHKSKLKNSISNLKHIWKEGEGRRRVSIDDIDEWLLRGWHLGRGPGEWNKNKDYSNIKRDTHGRFSK